MASKENYCQACLSSDRKLYPLLELQAIIDRINMSEMKDIPGGVCWECRSVMMRFSRFRRQVMIAQNLLCQCDKLNEVKSLTLLSYNTPTRYNYKFKFKSNPLSRTKCKPEVKIKEEFETEDIYEDTINNEETILDPTEETSQKIEELFNIIEEKPATVDPSDIYIDILNSDTKIRINKVRKPKRFVTSKLNTDIDEEELKQKFSTVVFTEEEMLRSREEKRSQPNFKKIPYKCDSCVLGFTRKDTYDVHMDKKHDKKNGSHVCPVCEIRFTHEKQVARHKRKHYVCYKCRLCKYDTLELWSALAHCRAKHGADTRGSIHCAYCTAVAKTPEELTQHITKEHAAICNECGEKFKGLSTLRSHIRRIHGVKREFICDVCTKTFRTKSRLESHMVNHDATLAQSLAYCAICRVQYKNIYIYRSHLRTSANHADQAYQCRECHKKFASKVYWKKHYNFYHLHKSQFHCELCNKLFISDWRLRNHRQTQHGLSRSRDYHCNVCGKQFFTLSTLKGHQLTHSEHRSFMCEDCGDTFKQRPALYNHYKLVHKGLKRRKHL